MRKHTLLALLCFVLMLSTSLVLASCGGLGDDDETTATTTAAPTTTTAATTTAHQHVYSHTTVAPTCTADGYTLHECACGHSYQDTPVPASHTLSPKIVRYPTTMTEGVLRFSCSKCDYVKTEAIEVVTTVTLPSIAEAIASALPDGTFEISDLESIPSIALFRSSTVLHNGEPYTSSSGDLYYALKIGAFTLTVDGTDVNGHLALEVGTADLAEGETTTEDFEKIFSIDFYMEGDGLSVAVNGSGAEKLDLSDEFYAALAEALGVPTAALTEAFYVASEMESYLPVAEAIANAIAAEVELPTAEYGIADFLALLGKDLVVAETDETTGNITYTVDFASVVDALAEYVDMTVADVIDAAYGEGTATALMSYIALLPDKKLGEIADSAILLSETYEIDLDLIYALINRIVYNATGEDFDVELAILDRYDDTLAAVASELTGAPAETIKGSAVAMTAMLSGNTFAEWYHATFCGANETPHEQSTCTALEALLTGLSDDLAMITVTATVDAEGNTLSYEISCPLFGIVSDAEGVSGEVYLPGLDVDFSADDTAFTLTVTDMEYPTGKYVDIAATLDNGMVMSIDVLLNSKYAVTPPAEDKDPESGEPQEMTEPAEPTVEFRPILDATLTFTYGEDDFDVICTVLVDIPMPIKIVVGIGKNAVALAYGAPDAAAPDAHYQLAYTPADNGFSITVTDLLAEATMGSLTYTADATTGDVTVALVTPFGEFAFVKATDVNGTVYKITTLVNEDEVVLVSLTLGDTLVIEMNNPIFAGKVEVAPAEEGLGAVVTFTNFSATLNLSDHYFMASEGENGEKGEEIAVDTYSQYTAVLNGALFFVYTAPVQ